jgi:hypothetical protein
MQVRSPTRAGRAKAPYLISTVDICPSCQQLRHLADIATLCSSQQLLLHKARFFQDVDARAMSRCDASVINSGLYARSIWYGFKVMVQMLGEQACEGAAMNGRGAGVLERCNER